MMKIFARLGLLLIGLIGSGAALASPALVTTDLNMRTGPGTGYERITVLPNRTIVDVTGCTGNYNWCRINWRGIEGWASGRYLAFQTGRYSGRPYVEYGAAIGIPLVAGIVIGSSYNRGYYGRGYYGGRYYGRDYYGGRYYRGYKPRYRRYGRSYDRSYDRGFERRINRERRYTGSYRGGRNYGRSGGNRVYRSRGSRGVSAGRRNSER